MTAPARATRLVLALALLPAATATHVVMTSDLSIYFADPATGDIGNAPEDDTCTYSTEFVQSMDAQAGCGIPIVVDGVAVNQSSPPIVTWIANGRNAIHIKTRTQQIAPQDDPVLYNITVGLQISSYSDDRVRLCDQMSVLRQGYEEGMTYVPITNLGDPTSVNNDATITARAAWRKVRPDHPCLGPTSRALAAADGWPRLANLASRPVPTLSPPQPHDLPLHHVHTPSPHPRPSPTHASVLARRATRATQSTRSRTRCGQFMGHLTPSSPSCSSPASFRRCAPRRAAPRRTAPHRAAPRRTAPHRAAPLHTAPHRTATPPRRAEYPFELLYRPGRRDPRLQLRPVQGRGRVNDGEQPPPTPRPPGPPPPPPPPPPALAA